MTHLPVHGDLRRFLLLTFAINWAIAATFMVAPPHIARALGEFALGSPAFYVAVYAPTIAAVALAWRRQRESGAVTRLFRSLIAPAHWAWFPVSLALLPVLIIAGQYLAFLLQLREQPVDLRAWLHGLRDALWSTRIVSDPGALGEELGWRGFALPLLLLRYPALIAGAILGLIWGVWHLPAFYVPSLPHSTISIAAFICLAIALSVIMAWLYVQTGGNVVFAGVLPHFMINACLGTGQVRIDWQTNAIVWMFVAALLAWHGVHLRGRNGQLSE
jgi:membrane protease YdiL (CAAX protease family)